MAEVYFAKVIGEENFQRLLAIKCMLPSVSANEDFVKMFVDEAKLASQLAHPNIVQIFELGRIENRLYIAMELVNGRDIGNILQASRAANQTLPLQFSTHVIAKAAEGLDFAHHKVGDDRVPLNLIHRDVSPQNILVSYDGAVKVADFGIAKADTRIVHTTGNVLKGKAAYMSPEQVRGRSLDKRSDVFALGATLYEMITGHRLFRGQGRFAIMEKVRAADIPPLSETHPGVPAEFDEIVRRALAREPLDRYQSAEEMCEALTPFLIQEGAVYGARQAGELMTELFVDEIAKMGERYKLWIDVRRGDCVGEQSDEGTAILFQSTFEMTSTVRRKTKELGEVFEATTADAIALAMEPTAVAELPPPPRSTTQRDTWLLLSATILFVIVIATLWSVTSGNDPVPANGAVSSPANSAATRLPVESAAKPPPAKIDPPPVKPAVAPPAKAVTKRKTPTTVPEKQPVVATKEPASKKKRREPAVRYGYLSVRADGVDAAKVFIDGGDAGYSPVIGRRVRVGTRRVKIIEEREGGGPGRIKTLDVSVTPRHNRRAPLRLVVSM